MDSLSVLFEVQRTAGCDPLDLRVLPAWGCDALADAVTVKAWAPRVHAWTVLSFQQAVGQMRRAAALGENVLAALWGEATPVVDLPALIENFICGDLFF